MRALLYSASLSVSSLLAGTPNYFLSTLAGTTPSLTAPIALNQPPVAGVVRYDQQGRLYYSTGQNIWRLNTDGTDALIAGALSTAATYVEGQMAVDAPLPGIVDFRFDSQANLFVAVTSFIYKITPAGVITTFAGNGASSASLGGAPATGPSVPGTSVPLSIEAVAIDQSDNVYAQIFLNNYKLPICTGWISIAPDGESTSTVAVGDECQYSFVNSQGITGYGSPRATLGIVGAQMYTSLNGTTYALTLPGSASQQPSPIAPTLGYIFGVAPGGMLYSYTDPGLSEINLKTFAVSVVPGSGSVTGTSLNSMDVNPVTGDVALAIGYVVSVFNVASFKFQPVACDAPRFGGDGGPAALAILNSPFSVATDAEGNVYFSDADNYRIRKITPAGIISTIAGNGTPGSTGDGGSALAAAVDPGPLALDGAGNIYYIDGRQSNYDTIRKIDTKGNINTVVGGGTGNLNSGVSGTSVQLQAGNIAVDSAGDIYFNASRQVYEMNSSGMLSLVAGFGTFGAVPNTGSSAQGAQIGFVSSLAVDKTGDLYIGDGEHESIWEVNPQGILNLVAGANHLGAVSLLGAAVPAGPAIGPNIGSPEDIAVDSQGNVYFTPGGGLYEVMMVNTSGDMAPIGGQATPVLSTSGLDTSTGDGGDASRGTFSDILGLALDPSGNVYVVDGNLIREMAVYNPANPPPFVSAGGVIGAGGSFPPIQAVSPGGEVSVFGANYVSAANQHTVGPGDLVSGKVPTNLAGVCVSFGGTPAAMLGVYPNQLNVQVGALTPGAVTVQVTTNCGTPQAITSNIGGVIVQAATPEFYSFKPDPIAGQNPIAAVNAVTGAYIGPPGLLQGGSFTPASAGTVVQAYATGFGATSPAYGLGVIPGAAGTLTNPYSLTLGGVAIPTSSIEYAGISPCCAGFYQLDFTVPPGIPSGAQPLVITIAGFPSPPLAYIEIQ